MNTNDTIIYLFSGLGADKSVFDELSLLKTIKHKFIEWKKPKSEVLQEYALQLSSQIDTTKKVILIGISFGGMLAVSLSKHIRTEKVILISSVTQPKELPFLYRTLGKLKFYIFIPTFLLNKPNKLLSFAFGVNGKVYKKEQQKLYEIIKNTNPKLAKSFIKMIMNWKDKPTRQNKPSSIFKIHGTNDWILPAPQNCQFLIQNGGHFMILTDTKEINEHIEKILD